MLNDDPAVSWNFTYYYDWSQRVERYEHEAPQEDEMCLLPETNFKKDGEPCHITFANDGWSYVAFPGRNFCCKCSNSFGSIRFDWLKNDSSYVGVETVNNRTVNHWIKQGRYLNHYYSTVDKALPVRFFEIKKGNPKSWDFDLDTYSTDPIESEKFSPQCSNLCGGSCSQLTGEEDDSNTKTQ